MDGNFDAEEACRFLKIALLCTQDSPKLRPSMSNVVKMLTGVKDVDDIIITRPGLITDFMDLKVKDTAKTKLFSGNTASSNDLSSSSNPQDTSTFSWANAT